MASYGLTSTLGDAIDIRGPAGTAGAGSGDLLSTNNLSELTNVATARTNLGLGTAATSNTTAFAAASHTHTSSAITDATATGVSLLTATDVTAARATLGLGSAALSASSAFAAATHTHVATDITDQENLKVTESIIVAASDETTALTTGTGKMTFYVPYNFTISEVFIGNTAASSSGAVQVNVKKNGTTIFTTKPSIGASQNTSLSGSGSVAAVLSTTSLSKGDKMTIDIDTAGTTAAGLKVYFIGRRS